MRADNYKITQYTVQNLMNFVENGQIAIPEIQRPFVWGDKEVCALIDSLYEGYPIGYLIVWQNAQTRIRGFGKAGNKKILIDGQQRVTALMASLLGKEVLDDQYRNRKIQIAFNPIAEAGEESFAVFTSDLVEDKRWIPDISIFFRRDFSYRKFEKEYLEDNENAVSNVLEDAVDRLRDIVRHQVGIIELSFMLDIDVVSEIFIRINLQGKPLNQEDFVMSKISVNEKYEGDYIRNCIDYFCHLIKEPTFMSVLKQNETEFIASDYGKRLLWLENEPTPIYVPSYADVLKVVVIAYFGRGKIGDLVNLLSGKETPRGDVSKKLMTQSFEVLSKGVKAFVSEENYKGFLDALKRAGYASERLLYSQSVLNYCYAMYLLMAEEEIPSDKRASLIGKWMTMSLVTGHYQSAGDSTVLRDRENIKREGFASYLSQIEELRMGEEFYQAVLPEKFGVTNTRSAAYLAYIAASYQTETLYGGETVGELYDQKSENYQILPKKYLEKCGFKTREIYGQLANITYISKDIKAVVKKQSPADYKEKLGDAVSESVIKATLAANAVPENIFEIAESDVETFLARRRSLMAAKIKDYYKSL